MGNTMNASAIAREYPKNPPACTQCPPGQPPTWVGGFIDVPSNETCVQYFGPDGCTPAVQGPGSPAFIFLFTVWGVTALAALFWILTKRRLKRRLELSVIPPSMLPTVNSQVGRGIGSSNDEEALDETIVRTAQQQLDAARMGMTITSNGDKGKIRSVQYYSHSRAEKIAVFLVVFNGVVLFAYWLVLTADFYINCEIVPGSVDNACFFGTFSIFGNYDNNAESFFLVWGMMVVYAAFLSLFSQTLFDWVKIPCPVELATTAKVWVKEETQVLTSGHPSWATRLRRKVETKWALLRFRMGEMVGVERHVGRSVLCNIEHTPLGRRYFIYECTRYAVPSEERVKLSLEDTSLWRFHALRRSRGLDKETRRDMIDRCGPNAIPLQLPSLLSMYREEFVQPFYAYQLTIYLIWIWWTYWFVGVWLLLIVILSGCWAVYIKRNNLRSVYALAAHHDGVEVLRDNGEWVFCPDASELVCGDVVRVLARSSPDSTSNWNVPADLVLVEGTCAVDESGLTGESMPRSKTALSASKADENLILKTSDPRFKSHILFGGTKVLEASKDAVAVVLSIGTDATRGQLLSHVLFPVETKFRFDEEFGVAVAFLFLYAIAAFIVAITFQLTNGAQTSWSTILAYGVFTVSQIVSPMLKIALVAGRVSATNRLRRKGIVCVDVRRIDIAGKVRVFCFDKTGTLTKEGLCFAGYIPPFTEEFLQGPHAFDGLLHPSRLAATCHSLGCFEGKLIGGSVELAMFEAAGQGWTLGGARGDNPDRITRALDNTSLLVARRLAFDQERRLMSVIVEDETNNHHGDLTLYVKGAAESIAARCIGEMPPDYLREAERLALEGYYVLGIAMKTIAKEDRLKIREMHRDEIERDLTLLGLLVFSNDVKPDALPAIEELKRGKVRCVMITGDSAPCGCFVARRCGMVQPGKRLVLGFLSSNPAADASTQGLSGKMVQWKDVDLFAQQWSSTRSLLLDAAYASNDLELVVTGDVFQALLESGELLRLLPKIRVFARMSPTQKVEVVQAFMDGPTGVVCAFAGDGANDSGALRAAHVGLSMGAAEASVVAPFSSAEQKVYSCVDLIVEGRCALATSLASYKLLVVYGLLFSIVKMASFYYAILMPVLGYIMIDIVALVPLTFLMTLSRPLPHLGTKRPTSSLLGMQTVSSIFGFLVILVWTMGMTLSKISSDAGYVRWPSSSADTAAWWFISDNWEATTVWETCFLLFIGSALVFSFGSGYRDAFYKNYWLVLYVLILFLISSLLLLLPVNWLSVKFHIASEQFNREGTQNPVWQAYQANGGKPSPAMSYELRRAVWVLSLMGIGFVACWEKVVVYGPWGRWLKDMYVQLIRGDKSKEFDSF